MLHKTKELFETTADSRVYRLARWNFLEKNCEINCGWCRPHRGENYTRSARRSWKNYRNTQYKEVA